ncbi:hypothetical protein PENFLA_c006G07940 [Penicillium flavigenum]|uniref:Uncharacterized protein n=1 Tax=Penicillium flavigenum TaxID=254877 RepID=A0A1V6TL80_9EURO|nr:hypothetical protein PENFLA_c006G07940 [Penicillium flavigenum]
MAPLCAGLRMASVSHLTTVQTNIGVREVSAFLFLKKPSDAVGAVALFSPPSLAFPSSRTRPALFIRANSPSLSGLFKDVMRQAKIIGNYALRLRHIALEYLLETLLILVVIFREKPPPIRSPKRRPRFCIRGVSSLSVSIKSVHDRGLDLHTVCV